MFEAEKKILRDKLERKGISDTKVLEAIASVDRHLFVLDAMKHHAYVDVALPIGHNQTISQPYTVAVMTEALKLPNEGKVLEIGTGSGYQAAILEHMGMKVYSIERNKPIFKRTQKLLEDMKIRVATKFGDGTIGWDEFAPFDGIIVTAGSPKIPVQLKKQLAIGGKLVIPVGDRSAQSLIIITKIGEDEFTEDEIPNFTFVPLVGRDGWKEK